MKNKKGQFIKGNKGHLGFKHSEKSKEKISLNNSRYWLGKKMPKEVGIKISQKLKGKKLSAEHKKKLSEAKKNFYKNGGINHKGMLGKKHSEETRQKISKAHMGRIFSIEHRQNLSGANCHLWKGGITPINRSIRASLEYRLWRRAVFKRDNYTCQDCGAKNSNGKSVILNADHIKPFSLYSELRFELSNGKTLCIDCHKKTNTYGFKIKSFKKEIMC